MGVAWGGWFRATSGGTLCLLAFTGCISPLVTPDGADVDCAAQSECPSGWSCNLDVGKCLPDGAGAPAIVVNPRQGLQTNEAGLVATFAVVLATAPSAPVTLQVVSDDPAEGTTSVSQLQFNADSWEQPQTVSVTGVDDEIDDGDVDYVVVLLAAESGDPAYAGIDPADVAVTNADDDEAGVDVVMGGGNQTTEAGGVATFTVVLTSEPLGMVVVSFASSDTSEGTVLPSSVEFGDSDWSQPRLVEVSGVDDLVDDGHIPYEIALTVVPTNSPAYDVAPAALNMINADDDEAGITLTPNRLFVRESGGGLAADTFEVVLTAEPAVSVAFEVVSSDTGEVSVVPDALTFDWNNWETPQTVTVTSVDDGVPDGSQTVSVVVGVAAGAGYAADDATVTVSNIDAGAKRMFVSETTNNGALGGVAGADGICGGDANKPSGGTFLALIARANVRDACTSFYCLTGGAGEHNDWVLTADTAYTRTDGITLIGTTNSVGVLPTSTLNPITDSSTYYWTGLENNWTTSPSNCDYWGSSSSEEQGRRGIGSGSGATLWSASSRGDCDTAFAVLCVEQ